MAGSEVEENQVDSDGDSIRDGEKEVIIVKEGQSQQSLSSSNDEDEDIERQDALSTSSQMEEKFISDGNITDEENNESAVEERVSPVQQNVAYSDDQKEESAKDESHTSSQMDDTVTSDNKQEILEVVELHVEQNESITDDQDEAIERDAASGRSSPLEDQLIPENNMGGGKDDDSVEEEEEGASCTVSQVEDTLISDENIRDGVKEDEIVEEVSPSQQMTSISEEDEDSGKEDASCILSQVEDTLRDVAKEEDIVEEEVSAVEQMTSISEEDEDSGREDASCTLSQVEDTLISDENIRDGVKEDEIVEEVSPLQQMTSISEEDEDSRKEDASCILSQVEDTLTSDDNIRDVAKEEDIVEEEVSAVEQMTSISEEDEDNGKEDASCTVSQVEDTLISDDIVSDGENEAPFGHQKNCISDDQDEEDEREDAPGALSPPLQDHLLASDEIHDGEKDDVVTSPLQQNMCIPDGQVVEGANENSPGTSFHIEEDDIKSYQTLEEESQSLETDCLEFNQVAATSREIQEMPCEVTTLFSHIGYSTQDVPERQDAVGQELAGGANMLGLDEVVTSSEQTRSSMVATGQVSLSGATGSILTSGQVPDCETTQTDYPNTDKIKTEQSESGDLTLEKGKADVTIDLEIREGDASGQVSPIDNSQIQVVDKTLSSMLETGPGLSQTGVASFDLNESVQMAGEAAGVDPNTVGKTASIEVSEASHYMHGAEASEDQ
ncbi:Transthyretin, partial [Nibea albiflora]